MGVDFYLASGALQLAIKIKKQHGLLRTACAPASTHSNGFCVIYMELELIQAHMTQKNLLWVEAGAHAVRKKKSECAGMVRARVGVA